MREMLRSANACGAITTTKTGTETKTPDKVHKHKFLLLST
jgi:fructose-1-phosphate kinase PfkB-like protein